MIEKIIFLFPIWMILFSIASFFYPPLILWFKGSYITYALGFIMLGMGMTMKLQDFKLVLKSPKIVFIGIALQYTIMPASGFLIAKGFNLDPNLSVGLILVSCCPGGTASNVLAYIAKADVALSITLTTVSTFLAIFLTPLLTLFLAGTYVEVNATKLFLSTLEVIIFPIVIGILFNKFLPKLSQKLSVYSPLFAILMIIFIVTSVLNTNQKQILESGSKLLLAVFLLHFIGFIFGYIVTFSITKNFILAKTISIEVGMQNSGLGVILANKNFSNPLTAVPAAISSFAHSMIASLLAWIWRK